MVELHAKKKLEIIVEAPIVGRVLRVLERDGAGGYTVLRCLAGSGHDGAWQQGDVSDAVDKRLIVVIADADTAQAMIDDLGDIMRRYSAILYLSDVQVMRPEHF